MIKTSNYNNCHTDKYQVYSISRDKGKDANYVGDYFLTLAPKREFFKTWRHNRGLIDEVTNNDGTDHIAIILTGSIHSRS